MAMLQRARWRMEAGLLYLFWQVCARLEPHAASAFGQRLLRSLGPYLGKNRTSAAISASPSPI